MKATFLVNPALKPGNASGGVESVKTDMLMLTTLCGLGLGPSPQAVDALLAGELSEKIKQKRFRGKLGESVHLEMPPEMPARRVLLVGLGSPAEFDYCAMRDVMHIAIARAINHGASRITMEIVKDRLTAGHVNLRGTAAAVRDCVEEKVAELGADLPGELEIELVCTPQAARHLKAGLQTEPRSKRVCCNSAGHTECTQPDTGCCRK